MPKNTFINLPLDKKNRIMDAIMDEFGRNTYEHINLANIIRDSQIPRGSFYQYFVDKDDVFQHLNQEIQRLKYAYFGPLFSQESDLKFIDRLENILTSSFGFAIKYPKITKIGQKLAESNFYRTHPMAIKSIEMANQTFENWIQIDVDKGFIKRDIDVKHLARIIVKIINQPIYYENLSDEEITKNKQEIRVLIDLLKKGMETDV
ncbi:MAG: TetR/AcrR family transcriptional regulator [Acholeplasmataceae bacterium]